MKSKKTLVFLASILILVYTSAQLSAVTRAQEPTLTTTDLPSDLSLDLVLANQNPAPDQKEIVKSQTQQAVVVSSTGETSTVTPRDIVAPQAKTERQADAVNPEQTTSEQVVVKTETVEVNENTTPTPVPSGNQPPPASEDTNNASPTGPESGVSVSPGTANNLVPGTNVVEPDDNSAPTDNSENPNLPAPTTADNGSLSPSPSGQQQTNPISPSDNSGNGSQPSPSNPTGTDSSNQQNIPLESQPQTNPTSVDQSTQPPQGNNAPQQTNPSQGSGNSAPQQQSQGSQPSSDSTQQSQPSSNDSGGSNDQQPASGDNPSVQGAATGPKANFFQQLIINIRHFLTGK